MTDHLPALIAAGRAASEGATEGQFSIGDIRHNGCIVWVILPNGAAMEFAEGCLEEDARHIAAHPPQVTRALWDAAEALSEMIANHDDGLVRAIDSAKAISALARLRALAEAER